MIELSSNRAGCRLDGPRKRLKEKQVAHWCSKEAKRNEKQCKRIGLAKLGAVTLARTLLVLASILQLSLTRGAQFGIGDDEGE